MTKRILTIIVGLLAAAPAFSQFTYRLEINSSLLSGRMIYLNLFNNHDFYPIKRDSAILTNGHAEFSGEISQPSNFAAVNINDQRYIETNFVLDSGLNIAQIELPVAADSKLLNIQSNSRGNKIYDELTKISMDLVDHRPLPARENGYLKIPLALMDEITAAQMAQIKKYPYDFAALLYLYRMGRANDRVDQAKAILTTLSGFDPAIRNSSLGKQLQSGKADLIKFKDISKAGNDVPVFKVNDIDNKPFTNKSLSGKAYLIVFSATWCGPCQLQLPQLKKLYQIYSNKGLKVIYFNIDDDIAKWKEHVKKNELNWINVSERLKPSKSKIQKSFGVYSIPTCFLISKQGKIIYNSDDGDPGIEQLESYLKQYIK